MQIPLDFYKSAKGSELRLRALATITFGDRPPVGVAFIVDTGSPVTFVDEFISSKVRIYTKSLEFDHDALMGGTKVAIHRAGRVSLDFRDSKGSLRRIDVKDLMVAKTGWTRKGAIYSSVSILGLDFLMENKLALHINPSKGVAYIETEGQD
ncbi:MAG: hypothetical protein KGH58_04340 [Candidatus Micrarchaeota archaeon]|nr:hypothetical protein [Candidatus Micrarchaeota archaeon]